MWAIYLDKQAIFKGENLTDLTAMCNDLNKALSHAYYIGEWKNG